VSRARLLPALLALALGGGCSGDETAEKTPVNVVVRASAADAARSSGVELERLVQDAAETALARLEVTGPVRIEVKVSLAQEFVIPEVGYGGFVDGNGDVFLEVEDPLRPGAETWLTALVAHELHHTARLRAGVGLGATLAQRLVSEGLADHFAEEVYPDTPPHPWNHTLSSQQETSLWRRVKPQLHNADYDPRAVFGEEREFPPSGYTLGYRIVAAYLGDDKRASDAVEVAAGEVMATYAPRR
jgi:uncharacterized protein YjaZ